MSGAHEIEVRPYGPDSTPEEVEAIRARVFLLDERTVGYREMPVQTPFHIDLFDEKMRELTADIDAFDLLIDLSEAKPPSAETRARLRKLFGAHTKMSRAAVFTGKNFMLNIAAKFVLSGMGLQSFSVHTTREQALEALRDGA
jgi:hypothetical protein